MFVLRLTTRYALLLERVQLDREKPLNVNDPTTFVYKRLGLVTIRPYSAFYPEKALQKVPSFIRRRWEDGVLSAEELSKNHGLDVDEEGKIDWEKVGEDKEWYIDENYIPLSEVGLM